jgi:hypothetical protein
MKDSSKCFIARQLIKANESWESFLNQVNHGPLFFPLLSWHPIASFYERGRDFDHHSNSERGAVFADPVGIAFSMSVSAHGNFGC